jgi:hypothetical protein
MPREARRNQVVPRGMTRVALSLLTLLMVITGLPQIEVHHHDTGQPHPAPGLLALLDHVEDHHPFSRDGKHDGGPSGLHAHETNASAYVPTLGRTDLVTRLVLPQWLLPLDATPSSTIDSIPPQRPPIA